MDPVAAVQVLSGAARWRELARHGVSRRAVEAACRRGDLMRCGVGVVCLPGFERDPATVALRLGAVLSCGSAATHHELEVFGTTGLHVTRASSRCGPSTRAVVVHRRFVAADSRSTTLRQTLLDCARCLPVDQAVSVLDSALRQGRVEPDELSALVSCSGRYAARVAEVVRLTDPQAQSVLESGARVLLVRGGLGPVLSQVAVPRVGWVDLVVRDWLVVEVDGYAVHRDRFQEDRRRDAELTRLGYVVLRFTYEQVLHQPAWVLDVVRETLARSAPGARAVGRVAAQYALGGQAS